ncbi:Crp/Fnr family transcriptional regulator [Agrobacterium larrymoorei]|uniref:Cyclic nucleotide-binding domain-containing protein n=1 Tax=Agrobacterium larrymoorei TaxID=160699 RepID=A0A4D7DLX9_9HYPH|nr:cyclic nucleotide-binding domain-containing protein [Agrobacterium larrymoorei]QCI97221.1 cyclic nucleotide-binding domain-containing protein [Agrobacterium larrymoorei]QYA07347.1 cyclic nucleotide-binding domain-containing protein [Agrobacterium larrymoorei]
MNRIVKLSSKDKNSLLRLPFLGAVDEESALSLMEAASLQTLSPRHVLFREGEPAEHLYCVLNGYVRLFRTSRDGREADVRICGPGETFNDCLIFGADQNRYSAQIAESCTLARLELSRIKAMIEADTKLAKAVIENLSKSALTSMECVANDRLQTAPQRVAHYLITQAPGEKGSYSLRLPFQKSVLAGKLGLAPEALSRAFSSLRNCGVIVRGRVIQINDTAALRQV